MVDPQPTPDLIRAVRAGCNGGSIHLRCSYPECGCSGPERIVRAALAELATPSLEMIAAGREVYEQWMRLSDGNVGIPSDQWRVMMRVVLEDDND